jgi:beta-glucanase (GH16 family)
LIRTPAPSHTPARRGHIAAASLALCLLQACGGGGSGDADPTDGADRAADVAQALPEGPANPVLPPVAPPTLPGWQLVWHDEFDRDGLPDASKWDYDTEYNRRGWWNNELQYYSRARLDNTRVADGKLVITARRERLSNAADFGGQNYTSARLITRGKASWTYGRFEVRAKLPCALGTWPAIWTLGTGGVWPNDGEIDIMEQKGFSVAEKQRVLGTVHTLSGSAGAGPSAVYALPTACTAFHTYHLTWDASRITIGVNGNDYFYYTNPGNGDRNRWPFDQPQYLLLNVAVGGVLGGTVADHQLPATMEVDWVRVYRRL